jgi:hypothetical protein
MLSIRIEFSLEVKTRYLGSGAGGTKTGTVVSGAIVI